MKKKSDKHINLKNKKTSKEHKKVKKIFSYTIKVLLIIFVLGVYFLGNNETFSNKIALLALSEDKDGEVRGGSIINLELEITPGTGQVFVNSKTLKEVDTQLSIVNSKKQACELFNLDCSKYDFLYSFEGESLILKGPSASAAIAIITAKTINKEKISNDVAITGSLNSGGIIGIVGGIEEKILLAEEKKFKKVLVPTFGIYNETKISKIQVVKVLDVIQAYNEFGGKPYELKDKEIETKKYDELMSSLSKELCQRSEDLLKDIEKIEIEENSTSEIYFQRAKENLNSSKLAEERNSFYSAGSFCFSANNFLKSIELLNSEIEKEELIEIMRDDLSDINTKFVTINSEKYREENVKTINDLYVLLLLNDRVDEASEFLESVEKKFEIPLNITNSTKNETEIPLTKEQLSVNYAYAIERMNTVELWEEFLVHEGTPIIYDEDLMENACKTLSSDITLKSGVLEQYGFSLFNNLIDEHQELRQNSLKTNLCVYNGLELNGRINTVLSSFGVSDNTSEEYSQELFDITKSRLSLYNGNDFPLIPFIYFDYAEELYKQNELSSSLLYTNYALSFGNLDLFLQEKKSTKEIAKESINEIFENPIFLLGILLIIGFL